MDSNGSVSYYRPGGLAVVGQDSNLAVAPPAISADSFYVTADQLMPKWGFLLVGGSLPSSGAAAGNGRLTWVVNFAKAANYQVWLLVFNPQVTVKIDDQQLGYPVGGSTFKWYSMGIYASTPGTHYVDVDIAYRGTFNAILFSDVPGYDPNASAPQTAWQIGQSQVTTTSQRVYRAQPFATGQGDLAWIATAPRLQYDEDVDDWLVPATVSGNKAAYVPPSVNLWGAAGQYVTGAFELVAGPKGADVKVQMSDLRDPKGALIAAAHSDLRVAKSYSYVVGTPPRQLMLAKPLLHDDRGQPSSGPINGNQGYVQSIAYSRMGPYNNRLFWLTVQIPKGSPSGTYVGTIQITDARKPCMISTVAVSLDLRGLDLQPVDGAEGIIYLSAPSSDPNQLNQCSGGCTPTGPPCDPVWVSPAQYQAELRDIAAHGLNSITARSGLTQVSGGLTPANEIAGAGLTQTVIDMVVPGNAESSPQAAAYTYNKGIKDVSFWALDETYATCKTSTIPPYTCPNTPGSDPCLKSIYLAFHFLCQNADVYASECSPGVCPALHNTVVIDDQAAFDSLLGGVNSAPVNTGLDRPIMQFGFYDSRYPVAVTNAGKLPLSYVQFTALSAPVYLRAQPGLFNRAMKYSGQFSWAYRHFPCLNGKSDIFSLDISTGGPAMTYPDKHGLPITTRHWEAYRAAIDDLRYVQALRRAISGAEIVLKTGKGGRPLLQTAVDQANNWLANNVDNIVSQYASPQIPNPLPWPYYTQDTNEAVLDAKRRKAADLIVQINANL